MGICSERLEKVILGKPLLFGKLETNKKNAKIKYSQNPQFYIVK